MTESGTRLEEGTGVRRAVFAVALVALPVLLYSYMPRPSLPGSQFLVYPLLAATLAILLLFFVSRRQALDRRLVRLGFLLLLFDAVLVGSFLWNAVELRATAPSEIFRVLLLAIFLLYGYCVARIGGASEVRRGLLIVSYVVLAGQFAIAATQVAGLGIFDPFYQADKSRPFGALLRATGSFGNPSIFAWTVAQAGVIAFVLDSRRRRYLALLAALVLVVASGSRTVFLLFPFMVGFAAMATRPGRRNPGFYALLAVSIFAILVVAVWYLGEYLTYLAQLELVVTSGSLRSVNSFNARVLHWQNVFREFSAAGWGTWLIGLGSRPNTAVLDNDYLYVLFKFGVAGLILHLAVAAYAGWLFIRARRDAIAAIGLEYLLSALVLGLVAETLASWSLPLLLFLLLGITIGSERGRWRTHPLAAGSGGPGHERPANYPGAPTRSE